MDTFRKALGAFGLACCLAMKAMFAYIMSRPPVRNMVPAPIPPR